MPYCVARNRKARAAENPQLRVHITMAGGNIYRDPFLILGTRDFCFGWIALFW
jgi:hypothetical protein